MLYLYSSAGALTGVLRDYDSLITTERFREHSTWSGVFPPSRYAELEAAYFAMVGGVPEVFLVEKLTLTTGIKPSLTVEGRSASALLHLRTIAGTENWQSQTAGYMIDDMMAAFTSTRALPLAFGTGTAVGSAFSLQRSWGDCGEIALEILAAQGLGMSTRMDGSTVKLDVVAPVERDYNLGEKFRDGSTGRLIANIEAWRNFAYVLGEGEGAARVQVTVDQTSGAERRELYVDASDLAQDALTLGQYQAALSARGAAKLADTRRLEYVEAEGVTAPLVPGDVVWYDAGPYGASFMVTERERVEEGGTVRLTASLGEAPATLQKVLRRIA